MFVLRNLYQGRQQLLLSNKVLPPAFSDNIFDLREYSEDTKKPQTHLPSERVEELLANSVSEESKGSPEDMWLRSTYEAEYRRRQYSKALRPKVNPAETTIILFPGQGVQYVGMGKSVIKSPAIQSLYDTAKKILGYDLLHLCLNGPIEKLSLTVHCQPAVFVASVAGIQLMIEERRNAVESCVGTAGFSVGEFAALVLAGSLHFEHALKLVKIRAEAMQAIAEKVPSGMTTVLLEPAASVGNICDRAIEWCTQKGLDNPVCSVANHLWPHCKVIGGNLMALEFIEKNASELRIRKARRLPVSGAFHTAIMKPAADVLAEALSNCVIENPQISIYSNIDSRAYQYARGIRKKLPQQIYKPVKWEQIVHTLLEREKGTPFPTTFECGPQRSLTTMLRYQNRAAAHQSINIPV